MKKNTKSNFTISIKKIYLSILSKIRLYLTPKNKFLLFVLISIAVNSIIMVIYVTAWQYANFNEILDFLVNKQPIVIFNLIIVFSVITLTIGLIGDWVVSIGLLYAVITGVMFANGEKMKSRNTPLLPEDFAMAGEAGSLSSMVNPISLVLIILLIIIIIVSSFYISKRIKKRFNLDFAKKYTRILRLCLVLASATTLVYQTDFLRNQTSGNYMKIDFLQTEINAYNQEENYRTNGFIVGTIFNIQPKKMSEPENYSKESIQKIMDKYTKLADQGNEDKKNLKDENINIVFVMSESFIDPSLAKNVYDYGQTDPIPNTRKILQENSSGWAASSEYGGGTANVEFEALTGFSNYFLNTIPYSGFVSHISNFPSAVSFYNQNGYISTALHPYGKTMYKRDLVYPNLGFSTFKGLDDFKYTEKIDNSQYVSDQASFDQVLYELKNQSSSQFIHLVTMQNHMPYDASVYAENNFKVSGHENDRTDADKIETYLTGINKSDQAMANFINELNKTEEKTVVAFWGDHWPGIYGEAFNEGDDGMNIHRTPLFIYKNFETESSDKNGNLGTMSLNYLTPTILSELDVKMSPYQYMLLNVKDDYPALTKDFVKTGEKAQVLKDYELTEYDILTGKKWSLDSDFYESK